MNDKPLEQLIRSYKEKGYSEEEITKITQELLIEAMRRFSHVMMQALPAEDINAIEEITDKKQAEEEAMRRYREKSGQNPDEEIEKILRVLVDEYQQKLSVSTPAS